MEKAVQLVLEDGIPGLEGMPHTAKPITWQRYVADFTDDEE
jgi:hypothetical protein